MQSLHQTEPTLVQQCGYAWLTDEDGPRNPPSGCLGLAPAYVCDSFDSAACCASGMHWLGLTFPGLVLNLVAMVRAEDFGVG